MDPQEVSTDVPLAVCPVDTSGIRCQSDCAVKEITAKADANLRLHSLYIAGAIIGCMFAAHSYAFIVKGATFPMPDLTWALVMWPFIGGASNKLSDIMAVVAKK